MVLSCCSRVKFPKNGRKEAQSASKEQNPGEQSERNFERSLSTLSPFDKKAAYNSDEVISVPRMQGPEREETSSSQEEEVNGNVEKEAQAFPSSVPLETSPAFWRKNKKILSLVFLFLASGVPAAMIFFLQRRENSLSTPLSQEALSGILQNLLPKITESLTACYEQGLFSPKAYDFLNNFSLGNHTSAIDCANAYFSQALKLQIPADFPDRVLVALKDVLTSINIAPFSVQGLLRQEEKPGCTAQEFEPYSIQKEQGMVAQVFCERPDMRSMRVYKNETLRITSGQDFFLVRVPKGWGEPSSPNTQHDLLIGFLTGVAFLSFILLFWMVVARCVKKA